MRTVLFFILALLGLNTSYSQFYDVKIVKVPKEVGTRREPAPVFYAKNDVLIEKDYNRSEKMDDKLQEGPSLGELVDTVSAAPSATAKVPMFCSPLDTLIVSSGYGYREDPFTGKRKFHAGTDYLTASENVYAMMPGRIKKIGYNKKLGNYITIEHGELDVTYAHLHTVVGRKDDAVVAGQSIGISGSTGRSTGEHLHISMKYKKKQLDPEPMVRLIQGYAKQF